MRFGLLPVTILPLALSVPLVTTGAQNAPVTETLRLTHVRPSEVIQTLRQDILDPTVLQPKSGIPVGITRMSHDDTEKTITVRGSAAAIADLKTLTSLLDVKPRFVEVKMRLIEIRLTNEGSRRETVRQAPVMTIRNNRTTRVSIASPLSTWMSFSVTPHLNGDKSVSVGATLGVRHAVTPTPPQRIRTSVFTSSVRLTKSAEWKTFREVSPASDEELQKAVLLEKEPSAGIYPIYRWEVSATEQIDLPATKP